MFICHPALIHLILSVNIIIAIIYTNYASPFQLIKPLYIIILSLFAIVWGFFLNFLCTLGYEIISWILLSLPVILLFLLIIFGFFIAIKK